MGRPRQSDVILERLQRRIAVAKADLMMAQSILLALMDTEQKQLIETLEPTKKPKR